MEFELGVVSLVEEELAVGDDAMGTRLESHVITIE